MAKLTNREYQSYLASYVPGPCWRAVLHQFGVTPPHDLLPSKCVTNFSAMGKGARFVRSQLLNALINEGGWLPHFIEPDKLVPGEEAPLLSEAVSAALETGGNYIFFTNTHVIGIRQDKNRIRITDTTGETVSRRVHSVWELTQRECDCADPVVFGHARSCVELVKKTTLVSTA